MLSGGLSAEAVDEILSKGIDTKKIKDACNKRYTADAYRMFLDVWRKESPSLPDAIRSFKNHVEGGFRVHVCVHCDYCCCQG